MGPIPALWPKDGPTGIGEAYDVVLGSVLSRSRDWEGRGIEWLVEDSGEEESDDDES